MPRKRKTPKPTGGEKTPGPQSLKGDQEPTKSDTLSLNRKFADEYQSRKRKEFLAKSGEGLFPDDGSDESESSEEDEDNLGVLLTKGIDRQVRETLQAIRTKDPRIYDKNERFFKESAKGAENISADAEQQTKSDGLGSDDDDGTDSDDEPVAGWDALARDEEEAARKAKFTLKDYVRESLVQHGALSDDDSSLEVAAKTSEYPAQDTPLDNGASNTSKGSRLSRGAVQGRGSENESDSLHPISDGESDHDHASEDGSDDAEDDGFFRKKEKSEAEIAEDEKEFEQFITKQSKKNPSRVGDEILLHAYLEKETPDEKERFLQDFVLNNGWMDKRAGQAPNDGDYEIEVDKTDLSKKLEPVDRDTEHVAPENEENRNEDSDFENAVDDFEKRYNFRFEEPDGDQIVSHARKIEGSLRRPDERRKRAREARRERKAREKLAKTEDIKHLKNLKKQEIEARLAALQDAAGDGVDFSGMDLDKDFDPAEFSKQMEAKFGDDYYEAEDTDLATLREDGYANATERLRESKPGPEGTENGLSDGEGESRREVHKLVDEYYNLDYEDIIGGTPVRFKYKAVEPGTFGLDVQDILQLEDKDLNRKVSLKYLAPYRKKSTIPRKVQQSGKRRRHAHDAPTRPEDDEGTRKNKRTRASRKKLDPPAGDEASSPNTWPDAHEQAAGADDLTAPRHAASHDDAETGKKKKRKKKKKTAEEKPSTKVSKSVGEQLDPARRKAYGLA